MRKDRAHLVVVETLDKTQNSLADFFFVCFFPLVFVAMSNKNNGGKNLLAEVRELSCPPFAEPRAGSRASSREREREGDKEMMNDSLSLSLFDCSAVLLPS